MDRVLRPLCMILLLVRCYNMAILVDATIPNIATDQYALLVLKFGISHPDPDHNILVSNWSTNTSVCNWIGVTCGSRHHRVVALNLSYMGLEGTIPPQIGNLSFLVSLTLKNNSFHGSVPNELSRLYRLKNLNFGFNNFNGEIPSSLGLLSKLQNLFLFGNRFTGAIPQSLSNMSSLERIVLAFNGFSGYIPSFLFNISTLQEIDLGVNKFSGPMPSILFNMPSVQLIDLSSNELSGRLSTNTFDHLPNLQLLELSHNRFYGGLPSTLFNCKQLQYLSVLVNNFTGRVPPAIGNLTMLRTLYLVENNFAGAIPNEIGHLQNLDQELNIGSNHFTGPIPFEIFNISKLKFIAMTENNLSGPLPSNLGLFLPNLQMLLLAVNELNGTIPSSIYNASQLTHLELSANSFSGIIPNTIGNLALLQYLNLGENNLTISSPGMNSLFSSLSNCKYLDRLYFHQNPLNVILPNSIGNLSTSLQKISLYNCNIKGRIFQGIGNLSNLIILDLANNELVGLIPSVWGKLGMLQGLYLDNNRLQGPIPSNLCHLKSLYQLYLGGNELVGQIPGCINNLALLRYLYLGSNKLTSTIPLTLWSMTDMLKVDLSSNSLSGPLSLEFGNMKVLIELDLSKNRLSGDIPMTIGSLKDLRLLSLEGNQFEGSIPKSFGDLVSLEHLDVSGNNVSGEIPKSLEALIYLKYLNVSFNRLRGEIPTKGPFLKFSAASFMSNDALCGAPQLQVLPCKIDASRSRRSKIRHILTFLLPAVGLTLILVASLILILKKGQKKSTSSVDLSPLAPWRRVSHHELLRATEGFNPSKLIGEGSFGSVYKATFLDGKDFAIKVLNLQIEGAFHSFDVECEVLSNIRHRNLVKIISTCSNIDFKAIVLEYMPNGNLENWLYSGDRFLSMLQRLNIMIDVATALEYLHFGYSKTIVHCDLKPNNILLDEEMIAHVADFGIAKLLGDEDLIKRTMTLATIGYMAPEYGSEGIVSIRGDVYSYGILLMETFTRKKPTDNMFVEEMNLKRWVEESLADLSIVEIIDANLLGEERYNDASTIDSVSSIMGLALDCCVDSPEERINTRSIPIALNKIKSKFLQDFQRT